MLMKCLSNKFLVAQLKLKCCKNKFNSSYLQFFTFLKTIIHGQNFLMEKCPIHLYKAMVNNHPHTNKNT